MRELRLNEFLDYLIEDIRQLWRVLGSDISRGVFYDRRGHRRRYRLSGRDKTNYYKKLETEVMSSLKQFIYKQTQRVFWEHDGFRSAVFFVPEELSEIIRSRTGYVVRFDWGKMELDDSI
jgi:hypothetical protein